MTSTTVVFGPKTRLGRAVIDQMRRSGEPTILVARDAADAAALAPLADATVDVVDASTTPLGAAVAGRRVRVVLAALGPIHAGVPEVAADAAAVTRELAWLEQVLDAGGAAHVVLVSTVLVLAPREQRRYYAGWKGVVEQQVEHLVHRRPGCTLSVLYPGRLIERRRGPGDVLTSTYRRLASATLAARPDRQVSRLVGADARILLLVRSISFAARSLLGSWGRPTTPS